MAAAGLGIGSSHYGVTGKAGGVVDKMEEKVLLSRKQLLDMILKLHDRNDKKYIKIGEEFEGPEKIWARNGKKITLNVKEE